MRKRTVSRASQILDLLPFAPLLTRQPPSPKLLVAATLVNSPIAKRVSPRLASAAQVVVAAAAVLSLLSSFQRRPGFKWRHR